MAISLDGQVAIVTGAGRGIGRAIALDLAKHGAKLVIDDIGVGLDGRGGDESVAGAVVAEIEAMGGEAIGSTANVAQYDAGYDLVKAAVDRWGRLDIVCSNAGFLRDRALHNMSQDEWQGIIDTHLTGAFNLLRHAWPVFRQQSYGRVVLTSSNAGYLGNFGQSNYGAAKAGLVGLMNVAKLEGARYNVMVNCLGPAAVTRMTEGLIPAERQANMGPELVAPAVTYLCSPDNSSSGMIIEAGRNHFGRVAIIRAPGIDMENASADDIAARWGEITSLEGAAVHWSIGQKLDDYLAERVAAGS